MAVPLSIVVPSYNGQDHLPRLLENLKEQINEQDEIVVVDDASVDETFQVATRMGVRVVQLEKNSGVGRARNVGAETASKEVLVFFDDDILPASDYLQTVRSLFARQDILCCQGLHSLKPANEDANLWQKIEAMIWRYEMSCRQTIGSWCNSLFSQSFCIRRDHFFATGGFKEIFSGAGGEEFEYSVRLMEKGGIYFTPELESAHIFQSFLPRLKTLLIRSIRFPQIWRQSTRAWQKIQFSHMLRVFFAAVFVGSLILALFWPIFALGALFSILGFINLDFTLIVKGFQWKKVLYIPLAFLVRILQYFVMGLGSLLGLFK